MRSYNNSASNKRRRNRTNSAEPNSRYNNTLIKDSDSLEQIHEQSELQSSSERPKRLVRFNLEQSTAKLNNFGVSQKIEEVEEISESSLEGQAVAGEPGQS